MMKQIENEMNFSVPLEIIKASEIEPKEVKWLWYPYIPFGKVTLLQGDPGDGKSKLMLSVAALLSKGKPLPFWIIVNKVDTKRKKIKRKICFQPDLATSHCCVNVVLQNCKSRLYTQTG